MKTSLLLFPLLAGLALFQAGCNSSAKPRTIADFQGSYASSASMAEIDASLDALEVETEALEDSYSEIQSSVLSHTEFKGPDQKVEKLAIFINENNVLVVNGSTMSRNDFSLYADRTLPGLCTPVPTISIDTRANYDTAAWVMDEIYRHGCTNVQVE